MFDAHAAAPAPLSPANRASSVLRARSNLSGGVRRRRARARHTKHVATASRRL